MKFTQLQIGQKFEYQGETYTKTSPLVATHLETGKSKMIPRYAELVVDQGKPEDKTSIETNGSIPQHVLQAALAYRQDLEEALNAVNNELSNDARIEVENRIAEAYRRFCQKLDMKPE